MWWKTCSCLMTTDLHGICALSLATFTPAIFLDLCWLFVLEFCIASCVQYKQDYDVIFIKL